MFMIEGKFCGWGKIPVKMYYVPNENLCTHVIHVCMYVMYVLHTVPGTVPVHNV